MVKTTKRSRKFEAKGGAKKMLEKGTITKKGKLRFGSRKKRLDPSVNALTRSVEQKKADKERADYEAKRSRDDFTSEENLGELDLKSFLQSVVADEEENGSADEFHLQESSDSEQDVSDDDFDDDDDDDDVKDDDDSDDDDNPLDDSDDEDIEAAEKRMKDEMAKLAETDPEFHDYLQKNEASLLEFQKETSEVDRDEGDEGYSEIDANKDDQDNDREEQMGSKAVVVDATLLKKLEYGAFESHGIKPLRKLVAAFVSACHMADTQHQDEDGTGRFRVHKSKRYVIESSTVFDKLLVTCLSKVHEEFHYHLLGMGSKSLNEDDQDEDMNENVDENEGKAGIDPDKPINPQKLTRARRWLSLSMSIKSFMKATLHLLSEAKEAKLLNFIIKALANYLPFVSAFPRLGNALLKSLTAMWGSSSDSSKPYQAVRVNAFLRIRQLAITQPFPFIEQCLKATYLAYAKTAKFANASTVSSLLPQLTFMGNCVVELYSLDYASSYQHAFVYIRQLALHLRSALQKKTPEAFRVVYCWQYMHCLKLWTAVLAATCGKVGDGDEESALMRSLIYPLVEIIFGTASLIPSTRHLPLRLHCVRFLQQLAAASETFIPTTSILLEVFDLKEVTMAPKRAKKGTGDVRGVRLPVILKLPKDDPLRTAEQLDACLGETFLLLNREVDLYKFSAGIPEFTVRITQRLRKVRISIEYTLCFIVIDFFHPAYDPTHACNF
jgi:nucleolar complex protein 2